MSWRKNKYKWDIHPAAPQVEELSQELRISPLIAQILCNREILDVEHAQTFLDPKLSQLNDPELLHGSKPAAERIAKAVRDKEKIVIYGDYDVDGITGVSILYSVLKLNQADVDFYVPHRIDEGYGVNIEAIEKLAADGAKLIITVDCGVTAVAEVDRANELGMEVIVTDHHGLANEMPNAVAIVHPDIKGHENPCSFLAGAGVAFKLAWQIAREIAQSPRVDDTMRQFLIDATSLAALGTIADMVPLKDENRILATFGLRAIPSSKHPGIVALLESVKLNTSKVDAYHVGFVLGPRLNACGRMGHASQAIEMFTDASPQRCRQIAKDLASKNADRQKVEREIADQAIEMVRENKYDDDSVRAIVLGSDKWHGGVIGIVASRLVNAFHKPTVLVAFDDDNMGQGSGRSIEGYHMRDALEACGENLIGFGGHAMAGGLKMQRGDFDKFAQAFMNHASKNIPPEQLQATLKIDATATFADLTYNTVKSITDMGPFGQGNPHVKLAFENCEVLTPARKIGRTGTTISLMLRQGSIALRAIGFAMGELADQMQGINRVNIVAQPTINTFNNRTSIELQLKDVSF